VYPGMVLVGMVVVACSDDSSGLLRLAERKLVPWRSL